MSSLQNMENSIQHSGIVDHIDGNKIFVKITQQSACAGCHARSMCMASDSKEKMVEVIDYSGLLKQNDPVIICGRSSMGLQAVFFAFVIPLILVVAAIIVGLQLQWGEGLSAFVGLSLLVPYYFVIYLLRDKLKKQFVFTLKKI